MEVSRKRLATAFALTFVLAFSMGYVWQRGLIAHKNPVPKANVFIFVETAETTYSMASGNVITDIGEAYTRDAFSQGGSSKVEYISIGNATAGTGLTQLTSQYDRKQGSIAEWTNNGDYAFNCTYKWTFTETQNINCSGGHWDVSGDQNLYAVANFPSGAQTFNANDNCTIVWAYTYDAND